MTPHDVSVEVDGILVTPVDGFVEISGVLGGVHRIRLFKGGRARAFEVTITEQGARPSRLEL